MISAYLYLVSLLISFLSLTKGIDEYAIYHTKNINPRPLLLSSGEVLGFSGNPGKMSKFTKFGEILWEENLNFTYSDNACIKSLKKEGMYVIGYNSDKAKLTLRVFSETKIYNPVEVFNFVDSFYIDIAVLSSNNEIIIDYEKTYNDENKKVYVKKYQLNEDFEFVDSKKEFVITTDNSYNSCIEIGSSSNILCSYVKGCSDNYVLLSIDFDKLASGTFTRDSNGCGYSKIINLQLTTEKNTFAFCAVKEEADLKCLVGSISDNTIKEVVRYDGIINNCRQNAKNTDFAQFSNAEFLVVCLNSNTNGFELVKVTVNEETKTFSKRQISYQMPPNSAQFPYASRFGQNFISLFYSRKYYDTDSKLEWFNSVYQIMGSPNCKNIENNVVFVRKEATIEIFEYLSRGTGTGTDSSEALKYELVEIPQGVTVQLYNGSIDLNDPSQMIEAKTSTSYDYTNLKLTAGPENNTFVISFVGVIGDLIGKRCSVLFIVNPCYEGCYTCTEYGTPDDNKCEEGCKEGYAKLPDKDQCKKTDDLLDEYYFNKTKQEWIKCFDSCRFCNGSGSSENHQCTECKEGYYEVFKKSNCIRRGDVPPPHHYLENDKIYKPCYSTCDTCSGGGGKDNHNCNSCLFPNTPLHGTKSCYSFPQDGFFEDTTTIPPVYKQCDANCKTCSGTATNCLSCDTYLEETICVPQCNKDKYATDNQQKKCINCKPNFKYATGTECIEINERPEDTFITNDEFNIIAPCFSLCATCNNKQFTADTHECTKCKEDTKYILQESNCICNQFHIPQGKDCINCADNGQYKFLEENSCINKPEGTYVSDGKYNIIEKCYETCSSCEKGEDNGIHNCDKCLPGKIKDPSNQLNCIDQCDLSLYNWYVDPITNAYKCTSDKTCNDAPGKFIDATTSECKTTCSPDFSFDFTCTKKCPGNTVPDSITLKCTEPPSSTCINNQLQFSMNSRTSTEDIQKALNDLIANYISTHGQKVNNLDWITLNDTFKIRLFKSDHCNYDFSYDSIISSGSTIPNVFAYANITECQRILQKENNLPLATDVIFIMVDRKATSSNASSLDYIAYSSPIGKELDIAKCKGLNNSVSFPLKKEDEEMLQIAEDMQKKGIDVFNAADPFFNDFCEPFYTEDGKDVIIVDRRKNFFKNVTLCESGCNYTRVDFITNRVECSCSIKDDFLNDNLIDNDVIPSFPPVTHSNVIVVKCYNLVFNLLYFKVNFGSWILIMLWLLLLVFDIVYRVRSFPLVVSKVNAITQPEQKANPPKKQKEEGALSQIPSESPSDMLSKNSRNNMPSFELNKDSVNELSGINFDKPKESNSADHLSISNINVNINEDSDKALKDKKRDSLEPSLDDLEFEEAIVKDKRGFLRLCCDVMKRVVIGLNLCCHLTLFEPATLRLIGFVLNLSFFFALNALLYSDDLISMRYNASNETLVSEIVKSMYVGLICAIAGLIVSFCLSFNKRFSKLLNSKQIKKKANQKEVHKELQKALRRTKCILYLFYLISFLLAAFFWYYVSAFCAVYQKTQLPWLVSCLISVVFIALFQVVLSLLFVILKLISLRCQCKICFSICQSLI